jgi:choline dehydrogenase-like flavoprotein
MIRDLRTLGDLAEVDTDVCIVGAGPAGISLALTLADLGVESVVLESGGPDPSPDVQALYEVENTGIPYDPLTSRLRQFGGTSGHWAGFCRPLEPIDLRRRDWVPASGWPLGPDDLSGYYAAAHGFLQLGPFDYDPTAWYAGLDATLPGAAPVVDDAVETDVLQFSPPTRFAATYERALRASRRIDVVLHANAVQAAIDEGGRVVETLTARSLDGAEIRVRARRFVLAAGGIENARLLLTLANGGRGGIGNESDNVGRYFADHVGINDVAVLAPTGGTLALYAGRFVVPDERAGVADAAPDPMPLEIGFRLRPADATQQRLGIAGCAASVAESRVAFDRGDELVHRFARSVDLERGLGRADAPIAPLKMATIIETAPHRESRVTLADTVDPLGLPRARLDFRLTDLDRRTLVEGATAVVRTLSRLGLARGRIRDFATVDEIADDDARSVGNHHIGTTRMSDQPTQGVVDADCLVHGSVNLYVAGSSVFPTTGNCTPTVNLLALAVRLADHLAGRPYRPPAPGIA